MADLSSMEAIVIGQKLANSFEKYKSEMPTPALAMMETLSAGGGLEDLTERELLNLQNWICCELRTRFEK